MNFVFLMDPLEKVIFEKDTSFILMLGAHRRKHSIFYLPDGGAVIKDGEVLLHVTEVVPQDRKDNPFVLKGERLLKDDEVDAVFIRTDPPFDQKYLMQTWLIERLPARIPVINRPSGIRTVNEKIWATQFTGLVPPTLVARRKEDILAFLKEHGDVVAKPTDSFGGQSIFHLYDGGGNVKGILETMTNGFQREIILQKFVPESAKGDKRILLLNGEPIGAVLRVAAPGEWRNNFFAGGKPVKTTITDRDREICRVLEPHLKALGLCFVGIDVMGDFLIEVNVTSPTCLQEINVLEGVRLEDDVIGFVEKLVEENRTKTKMS